MTVDVWRGAVTPFARATSAVARLGWETIVFAVSFVVVAVSHTRHLNTDGFLALSGGREITLHGLPMTDPMTVAGAGRSWIDQQWLGQVVLYRVWHLGGYASVTIVSAALVASSLALLCHLLLARGASPRRALKWTTLALCGALVDVSARTQDFAYPLFVLLLMLLFGASSSSVRPSRRWALCVLGVLVLWANLHGSVLVGAGLTAAVCGYRAITRQADQRLGYLTVAMLAPLTVLATPYGLSIMEYYRAVLGNGAIRQYSSEWQPALPTNIAAIGYLVVLVTVLAVVCTGWRKGVRPSLELGATALVLGVAGLSALRWGAWAAMVGVILATDVLNRSDPVDARDPRPPRLVIPTTAVVATAVALGFFTAGVASFLNQTPTGAMTAAARYADGHPGTRLLADDVSASALLWLHPELRGRVAYDGRLEIYRQADTRAWERYIRVRPGGMALARSYQVLVASKMNGSLVHALRGLPGVRTVYDGSDGIVVVRG
ncbi:MAG TPA: hypothetical protein VFJ24_04740 [Gaiellales bacterium]|nr:hypothetical protein [Gaiellales bacterium]